LFDTAIAGSLAVGSRLSYQVGANALEQFATEFHIPIDVMTASSVPSVQLMFRCVALNLRQHRNIKSDTEGWPHAPHIRSPLLNTILKGFYRENTHRCPKRFSSNIHATAAVMEVFFAVASGVYASDPQRCAEIKACAATQFYTALRHNEADAKCITGRDDTTGDSHHIMIVWPPFDSPTILISAQLTPFPPPPDGALFPNILSSHTNYVLKLTATKIDLDPIRTSTRCLRSGSVTMLRNMKHQILASGTSPD
jgi:hypothetical protein